jgi:hypothetical protein
LVEARSTSRFQATTSFGTCHSTVSFWASTHAEGITISGVQVQVVRDQVGENKAPVQMSARDSDC